MDKYELRRRRLVTLIAKACDGKQSELARKVGISESYVARMLYTAERSGRKRIGEDMVGRIAKAFDMDPGWFDTPYAYSEEDLEKGTFLPDVPTHVKSGGVRTIHPEDPLPDDVVQVPESRIEFSAGNGREAIFEVIEENEPANYRLSWFQKEHINPKRVRRFRVTGDSQEPFLFDGDIVLVNLDETTVVDSKLYAIRYDNDLRIKFLFKRLDGTLILRSMNPAYPDEEVAPELANEHISVIGRVRDKSGKGGL